MFQLWYLFQQVSISARSGNGNHKTAARKRRIGLPTQIRRQESLSDDDFMRQVKGRGEEVKAIQQSSPNL
jgi:hypothetical protein